jgi:hypothetical protein
MGLSKLVHDSLDGLSFSKRRKLISVVNSIRTIGRSSDLNYLAAVFKTDKWGYHQYTKCYEAHFDKLRRKSLKLLEIGVGGYEHPLQGAGSLRMWKRYFRNGEIFALDIFDKSQLQEPRIQIFLGSQSDEVFLESIVNQTGELDIIIDDGSHVNSHVITSFKCLFPKLKSGGIYVVEDTQTSYWPEYGGNVEDMDNKSTMMGYFKSLVNGVNHQEFRLESYEPTYLDKNIQSIHFYHNLVFVYKN